MSAPAVGVTWPSTGPDVEAVPLVRRWRYVKHKAPTTWREQRATGELTDARLVAAYRDATGHGPRNLPADAPGFEQWTYRGARTVADRAARVQALTGLRDRGQR